MSNSATPWTAARQASLFIASSWSLLKLISIESVMPSNHLIKYNNKQFYIVSGEFKVALKGFCGKGCSKSLIHSCDYNTYIFYKIYILLVAYWKRPWCWERLKAGGEGDNRGLNGWMASLPQWTRVWTRSRSCWWTGKPRTLRYTELQRVAQSRTQLKRLSSSSSKHDWLNWTEHKNKIWYEQRNLCLSFATQSPKTQTGEKSSVQSSDLYSQAVLALRGTSNKLSGPQFPKS